MKNILKNVFLNNFMIIFISFLILLKPYFLSYNEILNTICNIYMILLFIAVVILSLCDNKVSLYQKFLQVFLGCYLISTILGSNDYIYWLKFYIKITSVSLYTELLIKNNLNIFFKSLSSLMYLLIFFTFVTSILFPNGIFGNEMILLGYDNSTIILLIFGAMFILISYIYFHKKNMKKLYIVLGAIPFFMVLTIYLIRWSVAALIGCIIIISLTMVYFVSKKIKFKRIALKFINLKCLYSISIILFVSIVLLGIQRYFSFIVVDIFNKDITLTNRTYIWELCFRYIKSNPIFGMGIMDFESRLNIYDIYHAHSNFLNIILESGFVGFSIYTLLWCLVIKSVYLIKDNIISVFVSITLFSFLMMTVVDVIDNNELFYIFMVMSYFLPYIISEMTVKKKNNKNKILIAIDSGQPVPALNGGAIETLIDSIIKQNEKLKKYNIEVYSSYDKCVKDYSCKEKYTNYFYINSNSFFYFLLKCFNYIIKRISKKREINVFSIMLLNDLEIYNKLNYYDKIIIENTPLMINVLKNKINSEYILHIHNDINNLVYTNDNFNKYDKIICCSDFISNRVRSCCSNQNIFTVYNGVNVKELLKYKKSERIKEIRKKYGILNNSIVFGYCGRICEDKGTKELIEAFKKILKNNNNVYLVLTGNSFFKNSNPTPYIHSLLDSLKGFEDKIIFTGYFEHCEIGKFYSMIDIYIQPSIVNEACPLTIIESQIMNKIIITTNSGGIPELIKNDNVTIIDRKNLVETLSKNIKYIFDNYNELKKIKISKNIVKYFDECRYAKEFLKKID